MNIERVVRRKARNSRCSTTVSSAGARTFLAAGSIATPITRRTRMSALLLAVLWATSAWPAFSQTTYTPYTFTTLAGSAGASGSADGTGSAARFNYPWGVAVDNAGNVFVAEMYNYTIRKVTSAGVVTTLAGSPGVSGTNDGTGSAARFHYPEGLAVDSAGNVFVADYGNCTIRKVTPAGVVTTLAGSAGNPGTNDGTGSAARFYTPAGVEVDTNGNVFVADIYNSTIRKVTPAGVVTTLAGSAQIPGANDGTGSAARFCYPAGVAVDSARNVYVADECNNTIRKVTPAGVVTTLAGSTEQIGSADGTGSAARFYYPDAVAVDNAGSVFVADQYNNTIRKVTLAGVVTTLAGNAGNPGSADGTGSAARFRYPEGVAVDSAGNVYVADCENNTVRKGWPTSGGVGVTITVPPQNLVTNAGATVSFSVTATGTGQLSYQWRFNGQNIANATNATLTLNSVTAANSGGYSVVVSNPYGSVTSTTASLAVLDDGANGNTPVQPTRSFIPAKSSSAKNLVFITHGWQWKLFYPTAPPPQPWMAEMTNDIAQQLQAKGQLSNWQFETYSWLQDAWTYDPDTALNNATDIGAGLGIQIAAQGWQQVHLIAHSAGAGMIQEIADKIHANSPSTVVQTTFLDPFTGLDNWALSWYGSNATWSDEYYVAIDETSLDPIATGFPLPKTFAVDVSWVDPNHQQAQYIGPGGGPVALSSHGYPIDFYAQSIINTDPSWSGAGYGFILSMEDDGANWVNTQINNPVGSGPVLPNSPANAVQNPNSGLGALESFELGGIIFLGNAAYAASGPTATLIGDAGLELQSIWSALPLVKSGGVQPMGGPVPLGGSSGTNSPAWLAVGVSVTNAVNFVQFGAAFTDTNSAQGLLTVYWNTNQIGMVDERVVETNLQTYRFQLPGTVSSGLYTLSFRLDSFNNSSSIAVTNVATGFVGVTQPITLGISLTNGAPLLQLTAATNFNYLIQSSTNLVDWTPTALLLNTNGTAQFTDSSLTNSRARFYRALLQ